MKKHLASLAGLAMIVILCLFSQVAPAEEVASGKPDGSKINVLIVDGHNNHNWRGSTPLLRKNLEEAGIFEVSVATAPEDKDRVKDQFSPKFSDYDVVVMNYCDSPDWSEETRKAFVEFVENGGGLVIYHAANNAFAGWKEYNLMIGIGGWGGRNKESGPYFYLKDGKPFHDYESDGPSGHHGPQHEYQLVVYTDHPVTKDLPPKFMHTSDELYAYLRGPAENVTILTYSHSPSDQNGSGRDEPTLMAISYGKGRVFHTVLGDSPHHCRSVAFIITFVRGTQWAATGNVTIPVPPDMPTAEKSMKRD